MQGSGTEEQMKYVAARFMYGLWGVVCSLGGIGILLLPDNTGRHPTWDDIVSIPIKIAFALFPLGLGTFCWARYWHWTKESRKMDKEPEHPVERYGARPRRGSRGTLGQRR
jgi:hypothetical protein